MSEPKPLYSAEYRQQIIDLVCACRTQAELTHKFGPVMQSIANWIA